jgi:photosystem II stability/assembly factor-like uncharacterized protein
MKIFRYTGIWMLLALGISAFGDYRWIQGDGPYGDGGLNNYVVAPDGRVVVLTYSGTQRLENNPFFITKPDDNHSWVFNPTSDTVEEIVQALDNTIYCKTSGDSLVKYDGIADNGWVLWHKITGNTGGSYIVAIADKILFRLEYDSLYRTVDDGKSWTGIAHEKYGSFFQSMHGSLDGTLYIESPNSLYFSIDTGITWTKSGISEILDTGTLADFVVDRSTNTIYAVVAHSDGYSYFSSIDHGLTWAPLINENLPNDCYYRGLYCNSGSLYLCVQEKNPILFRLYYSKNGGKRWDVIKEDFYLTSFKIYNDVLYAFERYTSKFGLGLMRSLDKGATWQSYGLPSVRISAISSNACGDIFSSASYSWGKNGEHKISHLYLSVDHGKTWKNISVGKIVASIAVTDKRNLFISSDAKLHRSSDFGNTWVDITTNLGMNAVVDYFVYTNKSIYIVASVSGIAGSKNGIYNSKDDGNSWQTIIDSLPEHLYSMQVSPDNTIYGKIVSSWTHLGDICRFNKDNNCWEYLAADLVPRYYMTSYCVDKLKNVYGVAYDSLVYWNDGNGVALSYLTTAPAKILSIVIDPRNNNIIAGTSHGIMVYSPDDKKWSDITGQTIIKNGSATTIHIDENSTILTGVEYCGLWKGTDDQTKILGPAQHLNNGAQPISMYRCGNKVKLRIQVSSPQKVNFTIYSLNGRAVQNSFVQFLYAGMQELELATDLAQGIYICSISSPRCVIQKRINYLW